MQWCHRCHHCHYVTPISVPVASCDPKSHVASNLEYLGLSNVVVPLMMLSVSCDGNTDANGVTWPRKTCCTSFWLSSLRNAIVHLVMPSAAHDVSANGVTWSFCTSFWSSWPKECNGAIEDVNYICSLHWHHVIPMPVPVASHAQKSHDASHFSCLDLRNVMVPLLILSASGGTNISANGIT